jgi:hypothetical protein
MQAARIVNLSTIGATEYGQISLFWAQKVINPSTM